jgi:hypothetical protein
MAPCTNVGFGALIKDFRNLPRQPVQSLSSAWKATSNIGTRGRRTYAKGLMGTDHGLALARVPVAGSPRDRSPMVGAMIQG